MKSAVLNYINGCKMKGESFDPADIAASFQKAVVEVLVENSMKAVEDYGMYKFAIAGGVASNTALRAAMKQACEEKGVKFYHPSPVYCTDNAAMIGAAAFYEYLSGTRHGWDLNAVPNLNLGKDKIWTRKNTVPPSYLQQEAGNGWGQKCISSTCSWEESLCFIIPCVCLKIPRLIDEIILVCGAGEEDYCRQQIVKKYGISKVSKIIPGGAEAVQFCLERTSGDQRRVCLYP